MEPSSEALASRIEATRGELSNNLDELSRRIKDVTNWRTHYERHPVLFLGAAVVGGILLSRRGEHLKRPFEPNWHVPPRNRAIRSMPVPTPSAAAKLWSEVKAAAGTALASKLYSVVHDFIPNVTARHGEITRTGDDPDFRPRTFRHGMRSTNGRAATRSASQSPATTAVPEGNQ